MVNLYVQKNYFAQPDKQSSRASWQTFPCPDLCLKLVQDAACSKMRAIMVLACGTYAAHAGGIQDQVCWITRPIQPGE